VRQIAVHYLPDTSYLGPENAIGAWYNIKVVNADGSRQRTVTMGPNDQNPSWSPDGRQLVFQSDRSGTGDWDIYLVRWDGLGLTRLTSGPDIDQDPAWSPDGTKIAFVRNGLIHVMNPDGSGVTQLSNAGGATHPSWSPDGTRIAFVWNGIQVMNADGSGVVQLTTNNPRVGDDQPTWSPDGSRIVFQRTLDGWVWIYFMNQDGTGLTRVVSGSEPAWSPDSRRIVYNSWGIIVVMPDGTGMTRLSLTGPGYRPAWSLVGTMPPEPVPFRSVEMVGGNGQTGTVGSTLAQPFSVRVVGDDGTPQVGARIQWQADWGATTDGARRGALSIDNGITDANGISSARLTLDGPPGLVYVRAALTDGTARTGEVVFTVTAVP
jgi:Tol biopolymer transport system component